MHAKQDSPLSLEEEYERIQNDQEQIRILQRIGCAEVTRAHTYARSEYQVTPKDNWQTAADEWAASSVEEHPDSERQRVCGTVYRLIRT
jgi:hypothetical protein